MAGSAEQAYKLLEDTKLSKGEKIAVTAGASTLGALLFGAATHALLD